MKLRKLTPQFVKYIPKEIEAGTIYISMEFATATHKCCCGCGSMIVTPFSPTLWKLYFDGESITLRPSIGNWSFPCQSHYWIKRNEVQWDRQFSDEEIHAVRNLGSLDQEMYYSGRSTEQTEETEAPAKLYVREIWWHRLKRSLFR
jgi:hypothetical protein